MTSFDSQTKFISIKQDFGYLRLTCKLAFGKSTTTLDDDFPYLAPGMEYPVKGLFAGNTAVVLAATEGELQIKFYDIHVEELAGCPYKGLYNYALSCVVDSVKPVYPTNDIHKVADQSKRDGEEWDFPIGYDTEMCFHANSMFEDSEVPTHIWKVAASKKLTSADWATVDGMEDINDTGDMYLSIALKVERKPLTRGMTRGITRGITRSVDNPMPVADVQVNAQEGHNPISLQDYTNGAFVYGEQVKTSHQISPYHCIEPPAIFAIKFCVRDNDEPLQGINKRHVGALEFLQGFGVE
eukprot:765857-Hanusia_phi.AAC.6